MSALRLLIVVTLLGLAGCGSEGTVATRVDQALASGRPTLVEFGANSCTQCRKMSAVMAALAPRFAGSVCSPLPSRVLVQEIWSPRPCDRCR